MTKLMIALDTQDMDEATHWCAWTNQSADGFKIGLEYFLRNGVEGYRRIARFEKPIMLDLKLHDIPNTVKGAVTSLLGLAPAFITVHASGGWAMVEAARNACGKFENRPHILAVTVLTSLGNIELQDGGYDLGTTKVTDILASMAISAGADGIVCSWPAATILRPVYGKNTLFMCPGIRPRNYELDDQVSVATPTQARAAKVDWIVVGRPITKSPSPGKAAAAIKDELAGK